MVLMHTVQTYEGKAIVQSQRHAYDARMVLWLLDQHYSHSTAAIISLGDIAVRQSIGSLVTVEWKAILEDCRFKDMED